MFVFFFQFLNVPMFRNVTLKCLTEIGKDKYFQKLLQILYFLAHLCKLHGGLLCVTFCLSVEEM